MKAPISLLAIRAIAVFLAFFFLYPYPIWSEREFAVLTMMKTGSHMYNDLIHGLTGKKSIFLPLKDDRVKQMLERIEKGGRADPTVMNQVLDDLVQRHLYSGSHIFLLPLLQAVRPSRDLVLLTAKRDLRDVAVSFMYHLEFLDHFKTNMPSIADNIDAKLLHSIETVGRWINEFMALLSLDNVYALSFERLVGAKGGGSDEEQMAAAVELCNLLEIEVHPLKLQRLLANLWGNSPTFRKGTIGQWKEYFKEMHKVACKSGPIGPALIKLGYETGFNW